MTDDGVASRMHEYFLRMSQTQTTALTYSDFGYMLTSMQLSDGQVHSLNDLEDFYRVCQRQELAESSFFVPNESIGADQLAKLSLPQFIPLDQFVKAFEFLARKPLTFMYQEVIDKFYICSKQ